MWLLRLWSKRPICQASHARMLLYINTVCSSAQLVTQLVRLHQDRWRGLKLLRHATLLQLSVPLSGRVRLVRCCRCRTGSTAWFR